jgi:hypothetical protein
VDIIMKKQKIKKVKKQKYNKVLFIINPSVTRTKRTVARN